MRGAANPRTRDAVGAAQTKRDLCADHPSLDSSLARALSAYWMVTVHYDHSRPPLQDLLYPESLQHALLRRRRSGGLPAATLMCVSRCTKKQLHFHLQESPSVPPYLASVSPCSVAPSAPQASCHLIFPASNRSSSPRGACRGVGDLNNQNGKRRELARRNGVECVLYPSFTMLSPPPNAFSTQHPRTRARA